MPNIRYTLIFLFSLFVQVLLFDNVYIIGNISIYLYIYIILILPIEMNKFTLLLLSFILGLSIDLFNSTPGLNAAATVCLAYFRPMVLKLYIPSNGYEANKNPGIKNYGFYWFLRYAISLILIHHSTLILLEYFSFSHFFHTVLKILIASVLTLLFIILIDFNFIRNRKK